MNRQRGRGEVPQDWSERRLPRVTETAFRTCAKMDTDRRQIAAPYGQVDGSDAKDYGGASDVIELPVSLGREGAGEQTGALRRKMSGPESLPEALMSNLLYPKYLRVRLLGPGLGCTDEHSISPERPPGPAWGEVMAIESENSVPCDKSRLKGCRPPDPHPPQYEESCLEGRQPPNWGICGGVCENHQLGKATFDVR